jgi:Flp pilus assembly protein TadG
VKNMTKFAYKQKGVAAVEFALIATVFFVLLIGIVEMARVLFTWNAAAEATRYGARVATVCDINDKTAVLNRMRRIMPNLTSSNVSLGYFPAGCSRANCQQVKVAITNFQVTTYIPVVSTVLYVPPFTTTLPRESLDSTNNPVCT